MASTPAFVPVRVKIATSKCAIKIPTCPTSKRDFLPNDLTANILTKDESRLTTPTAYVPVRALNPLVLWYSLSKHAHFLRRCNVIRPYND